MSKSQSQSNCVLLILEQDYLIIFYNNKNYIIQNKKIVFPEQQTLIDPKFQRNACTGWDMELFREMLLNTGLMLRAWGRGFPWVIGHYPSYLT